MTESPAQILGRVAQMCHDLIQQRELDINELGLAAAHASDTKGRVAMDILAAIAPRDVPTPARGLLDLIEALAICATYTQDTDADAQSLTSCAHDTLYVSIDPNKVTKADRQRLHALGFNAQHENDPEVNPDVVHHADRHDVLGDHFYSFRFGSC